MQLVHARLGRELFWTAGGPLLVGACLGAPFGLAVFFRSIAGLPAVFFGVGLLMAPALYIVGAFLGVAPPVDRILVAARATFRDLGMLLLGMLPALLFLEVTTQRDETVLVLGHAVIGLATTLALIAFFRRVFAGEHKRVVPVLLYLVWSAVCLGMGWRVFLSIYAA